MDELKQSEEQAELEKIRQEVLPLLTAEKVLEWLDTLPDEAIAGKLNYFEENEHPLHNYLVWAGRDDAYMFGFSNQAVEYDLNDIFGSTYDSPGGSYVPLDAAGTWLPAYLAWDGDNDGDPTVHECLVTVGEMRAFLEQFQETPAQPE